MFLSLSVYLSEQHKLGELPRQHKAQIGDAQSDHGRPARAPCPGERRETEEGRENRVVRESVGVEEIREDALRRPRKHTYTSTHIQFRSGLTTKTQLRIEPASEIRRSFSF